MQAEEGNGCFEWFGEVGRSTGSLGRSSAKAQRTEVRSQALERTDGQRLQQSEPGEQRRRCTKSEVPRALMFRGGLWAVLSLWAFTVGWELLMDFEQRRDEV